MADRLAGFAEEQGLVRDLLWYLDMTTSPDGEPAAFAARIADVRARYRPGHHVIGALEPSLPDRSAAIDRAIGWLPATGNILDHP